MNPKDKTVILTGATQGIGRAVGRSIWEEGLPHRESSLLAAAYRHQDGIDDDGLLLAAVNRDRLLRVNLADKSENFLTGDVTLDGRVDVLDLLFARNQLGGDTANQPEACLGTRLPRIGNNGAPSNVTGVEEK